MGEEQINFLLVLEEFVALGVDGFLLSSVDEGLVLGEGEELEVDAFEFEGLGFEGECLLFELFEGLSGCLELLVGDGLLAG